MEYYWTAGRKTPRRGPISVSWFSPFPNPGGSGRVHGVLPIKNEYPLATQAEVKTRESGSNVRSSSEKEAVGQHEQETAM